MSIIDSVLENKTLNDLTSPNHETDVSVPELNKEVVGQAIELLKELEKNGGYGDIAVAIGHDKITKAQVKLVHKKMLEKIAELTPEVEVEPIE